MRLITLIICIFAASTAWPNNNADKDTEGLSIIVNSVDVNDKTLKLQYEIRNSLNVDVWILAGIGFDMNAVLYMSEDDQTLTVRSRLNLPNVVDGWFPNYGRYVVLRSGEKQNETILIKIPVNIFKSKEIQHKEKYLGYIEQLAIELGYYPGNLPELFIGKLQTEDFSNLEFPFPVTVADFSGWNERLISRDEEFSICTRFYPFEYEQIFKTTVDNLRIPYQEERESSGKHRFPDLISCKKIEIKYEPSMLEYFFPYASQQSLLNQDEIDYLTSENVIVVEDKQRLQKLCNDLSKAEAIGGGIIRYRSSANIVCWFDKKPKLSFPLYNNDTILIEGYRFVSHEDFLSLSVLTPKISDLSLRMQCATNLKNLWYRFKLYPKAGQRHYKSGKSEKTGIIIGFTDPNSMNVKTWCDDIVRTYDGTGLGDDLLTKPFVCPGAREGKNHYAMNPNCEPNSPGDMVLLFETRAGWNQHGGPEQFTFDNHNLKRPAPDALSQRDSGGGCVLLNDGTVKFIRTEEEFNNLRWKLAP